MARVFTKGIECLAALPTCIKGTTLQSALGQKKHGEVISVSKRGCKTFFAVKARGMACANMVGGQSSRWPRDIHQGDIPPVIERISTTPVEAPASMGVKTK
jgi:hypothetical protein